MQIVFDHDFDSAGNIVSSHSIDTSVLVVQTMLTAFKASAGAQAAGGYSVVSKHPLYPGQTRWQVILAEVVRLNDVTARGILGV